MAQIQTPPREMENAPTIYYMRMTEHQVDANLGKLAPGKIVPMQEAKAKRWYTLGLCEPSSQEEYFAQRGRRQERINTRQEAFQRLGQPSGDHWDVSMFRDVLTAPESGLRACWDLGIPLVNFSMLRDENGEPLPLDASIDEIIAARDNLHPDLQSPLTAHHRSSVMGGGSPYSMPMPLNPEARQMEERIREQERYANRPVEYLEQNAKGTANFSYDRGDPGAADAYSQEVHRTARNSARRQGRPVAGRVNDEAFERAREGGLPQPQQASGEQVGNAAEPRDPRGSAGPRNKPPVPSEQPTQAPPVQETQNTATKEQTD